MRAVAGCRRRPGPGGPRCNSSTPLLVDRTAGRPEPTEVGQRGRGHQLGRAQLAGPGAGPAERVAVVARPAVALGDAQRHQQASSGWPRRRCHLLGHLQRPLVPAGGLVGCELLRGPARPPAAPTRWPGGGGRVAAFVGVPGDVGHPLGGGVTAQRASSAWAALRWSRRRRRRATGLGAGCGPRWRGRRRRCRTGWPRGRTSSAAVAASSPSSRALSSRPATSASTAVSNSWPSTAAAASIRSTGSPRRWTRRRTTSTTVVGSDVVSTSATS